MSKNSINNVKRIKIQEIKNPSFLKNLSYKELNVLSNDIREELLRVTSKNGGHLSSNLGVVELTIALHRIFDLSKDKVIFDVGHQCYTHKILTGRSLDNLRKKDGVSGFQKINESVYDCYEAGHSSTSISAANGFAIARDLKKEKYEVVSVIGDSSITSGLAFEGLNNIAQSNHKVIIILNDNEMAISQPVGALSKSFAKLSTSVRYNRIKTRYSRAMSKTHVGKKIFNISLKFKNWFKSKVVQSNIFIDMGFAYLGPVDGHNIKALEKIFLRAKNSSKSVVIHVCTLKGKGYKFAENDKTGSWHGVGPFDIESGKSLNTYEGKVSWSDVFGNLTLDIMKENKNTILICPATLKGSSLEDVFNEFPDRSFDVGISEEHAVTMASSLSIEGIHPIISIYSTFMQRSYDEISHDLARMKLNATFVVDRSGLVGNDGETHQGIYDEGYLASIPNVVVSMPSNISEAQALYLESLKNHGPFFIRVPRTYIEKSKPQPIKLKFGKWIELSNDKSHKLAIIGVGPLLRELESELTKNNIKATLINAIYVNPIDKNALSKLLNYKKIVIYDPYSTSRGLVELVMAELLALKFKGSVSAYFVKNEFIKQATIDEQLKSYHLLPKQIIKDLK